MLSQKELVDRINQLKQEKNAIILAHYYQKPEIQDIADFVGDSLELSRKAADNQGDVIVFCGVRFMAETASTLSPDKTVLLPAEDAGCPMADMIGPEDIRQLKQAHPEAAVVCYVNTTTDIKAESDCCVTSSNAVKVVSALPQQEIIFVPDRNLGRYVQSHVPDKTFWFFDGYCPTHNFIHPQDVLEIRKQAPDAEILAHPECSPEVLALVDFIGSTGQILRRAKESPNKRIVICTEEGILHQLQKDNPDKEFVLLSPNLLCTNMKKIDLPMVLESLEEMEYQIHVPDDLRIRAVEALNRMLSHS